MKGEGKTKLARKTNMKKKSTAVLITVFIMSLLNVWAFDLMNIPQGCYTLACIISGVGIVFNVLWKDKEKKEA